MNTLQVSERDPKSLRILVPINANDTSRWGIQYALQKHREGKGVEVILLNVGEPVRQWEVLRFHTQQEIENFQTERAQAFFEDTAQDLLAEHISCRGFFRHGDIAFSILDVAEEMGCNEIVLPVPKKRLFRLFGHDLVKRIQSRKRTTRVVTVNRDGAEVAEE